MERGIARLQLRIVQNIVYHFAHPPRFMDDQIQILLPHLGILPMDIPDHFRVACNDGKRGAKLMGNIGDQFSPQDVDPGQGLYQKTDGGGQISQLVPTPDIGAGVEIIAGQAVNRIPDRQDGLGEMPGKASRQDCGGQGKKGGHKNKLLPVKRVTALRSSRLKRTRNASAPP